MHDNQPDCGAIAEKFDLWLPQIAAVGERLLQTLDAREHGLVIPLTT